ncbi:MAG: zf-HC2 domain-containing protein [Gemmatimonadales bacterium]
MSHPDDGILAALLDGELTGEDQRTLESHLRGCAVCRARLEDERSMMAEADGMIGEIELPAGVNAAPAGTPWWIRYRPLAWAATIVLAAGLGYAGGEWQAGTAPDPVIPVTETAAAPVSRAVDSARTPQDAGEEAASPPRAPAESRETDPGRQRVAEPELADAAAGAVTQQAAPAEPMRFEAPQVSRDEVMAKSDVSPMEDAVAELGGAIMLIDGLVPELIQSGNGRVQVTYLYPSRSDTVTLEQTRSDAGEVTSGNYSKLHAGNLMARRASGEEGLKWSQSGFELRLYGTVSDSTLNRLRQRVQ